MKLTNRKSDDFREQTVNDTEEGCADDNEDNRNAGQLHSLLLRGPRNVVQFLDATLDVIDDGVHGSRSETGHTLKRGAGSDNSTRKPPFAARA